MLYVTIRSFLGGAKEDEEVDVDMVRRPTTRHARALCLPRLKNVVNMKRKTQRKRPRPDQSFATGLGRVCCGEQYFTGIKQEIVAPAAFDSQVVLLCHSEIDVYDRIGDIKKVNARSRGLLGNRT